MADVRELRRAEIKRRLQRTADDHLPGADPRTTAALNCAPCGDIAVPTTAPASLMRRLPDALWDKSVPEGEFIPEWTFGADWSDQTIYGPIVQDATPQYELFRLFAEELDRFRIGWKRLVADQLSIGMVQAVGEALVAECPRASGDDLDRVGEQYGIGRPRGFTDCCYGRLICLLLFQPGPTRWRIVELAHLYTGSRPMVREEPAKLILEWPVPLAHGGVSGNTHWSAVGLSPAAAPGGFWGHNAYWQSTPPGSASAFDMFWYSGATQAHGASFWQRQQEPLPAGLSLRQAISLVRPAGVMVDFLNEPPNGLSGCSGATLRESQVNPLRSMWSIGGQ